jgi:hypothetical protein
MTERPRDPCSPTEAAFIADVSLPTITRAIRHGELHVYRDDPLTPGARQGKATWLSKAEVKRWRDLRMAGLSR